MNTTSSRWLLGIGLLVVTLVVASVLIALFGPGASIKEYPAGTPEGVVQRYLQALEDGDPSVALGYMEERARDACTIQEITQQAQWFVEDSSRRRIELADTRELADGRMQVQIRVTHVNVSPPFGVDEYSYDQWYTLIDEDGTWVLEYPAWPISWCQAIQNDLRGGT